MVPREYALQSLIDQLHVRFHETAYQEVSTTFSPGTGHVSRHVPSTDAANKNTISYPQRSAQLFEMIVDWAPLSMKACKRDAFDLFKCPMTRESISLLLPQETGQQNDLENMFRVSKETE